MLEVSLKKLYVDNRTQTESKTITTFLKSHENSKIVQHQCSTEVKQNSITTQHNTQKLGLTTFLLTRLIPYNAVGMAVEMVVGRGSHGYGIRMYQKFTIL